MKAKEKTKDNWEVKDRRYYLSNNKSPLTMTLASKHSELHPMMYFDEELGYERELRYATNQLSTFVDEQKGAVNQLDDIQLEIEALNLANTLEVDHAEAILRTELGSTVSTMNSKELKRDLMLLAKSNPALFISLAHDENVELRSFGIRAAESGIITLSADQKIFKWAVNGKKLMEVPFDEHPYSALASWFKTDEGMLVYKSIEKKFS